MTNEELIAAWRETGDTSLRDRLVLENMPLALYLSRGFPSLRSNQDEIRGLGTLGILDAIEGFNPDRGYPFSAYAGTCIRNRFSASMTREVMPFAGARSHLRRLLSPGSRVMVTCVRGFKNYPTP